MKQEDKDLLLKDLCARLPYGVKVQYLTEGDKIYICNIDQVSIKSQCVGIAEIGHTVFTWRTIDRIKPYLRPMSSMTKEEINKFTSFDIYEDGVLSFPKALDYLNSIHVDYRGLIPMGLALEAPEGMYTT